MDFKPRMLSSGTVLQSGLTADARIAGREGAYFVRGVVVATYVTDDPNNPDLQSGANPTAVYCDVLTYSTYTAGAQRVLWPRCLVCQDFGGMQSGIVHKPRAATLDVSGQPLDLSSCAIGQLDGDHVLCSYLDGNQSQPIILRGLPHPSSDIGNAANQGGSGAHLQLKLVDGSPYTVKQNGSFFGISKTGDIECSTLFANSGTLQKSGAEPSPPADGTLGNIAEYIHSHALRMTQFYDMSQPTQPTLALQQLLSSTQSLLQFVSGRTDVQVKDSTGNSLRIEESDVDATMTVGSGDVHVCIAEHLQSLYNSLFQWLIEHTHGTAVGPTSPPIAPEPPLWLASVSSSKVTIPDG